MARLTACATLFCAAALLACRALAAATPSVLELQGQHADTRRPDILFLAPRPTAEPQAYAAALSAAEAAGTALPNAFLADADFRSGGALPILDAAGYRFLPVRDVPWREACETLAGMLALRRRSRVEDGIALDPLCVMLCEDAAPGDLAATLPALLATDALVILAPQRGGLPLIVCWRNVVWPAHLDPKPIDADHWIPTMADIVGLPPPAECAAASIFPLLTGVGYQRPLEAPPTGRPVAGEKGAYAMLSHFEDWAEPCPWVPDFTNATACRASERLFLPHTLPLPAKDAGLVEPSRGTQGFYVRAEQAALDLTFPAGVSAVVRVGQRPVFSVWEPAEPVRWRLEGPEPQLIELFIVTPPGFDHAALPIFQPPDTPD